MNAGNRRRNGQPREDNGRTVRAERDDAWRELVGYLVQLEQYVSLYIRVREDALKVTARETLWRLILILAVRIAEVVVIAMSVVYVFDGTSRGLALALGGRQWLASLVTGGGALTILGLAAWAGHSLASRAAQRRRMAEYEEQEDRYTRAAARTGIPGPADEPGARGDVPRTNGHRSQRSKGR